MSREDSALRGQAMPYLGQVFGYNRNEFSDDDVMKATNLGDLYSFYGYTPNSIYPDRNNYIRILRPRYAEIISAYLSLVIVTDPAEKSPRFWITVGSGLNADLSAKTLTDTEIQALHTKVTGSSAPYESGPGLPIAVEKLDITPFIPKEGETNYQKDFYVIGVHFEKDPDYTNAGYYLKQFTVDCNAVIIGK